MTWVRVRDKLRCACIVLLYAIAIAAFGAFGAPGVARAQQRPAPEFEPPPVPLRNASAQVKEHLQRAQKFFKDQEFVQAAQELQQAYSADPRPLYLFNIGQAYRRALMPKEALAYYERFLGEDPKNALRGETEGYCNDMRTLIAEQERGAQVKDALSQEQRRSEEQEQALRAEKERAERTQLALQAERERAERERRRPIYKKGWFWGVIGVAVAATTAGIAVAAAPRPSDPTENLVIFRPF